MQKLISNLGATKISSLINSFSSQVTASTCEEILKNNTVFISLNCYVKSNLDADTWITLGNVGSSYAPSVEKTFPVGCTHVNLNISGRITTSGLLQIKSNGTVYVANSPMFFTISYPY